MIEIAIEDCEVEGERAVGFADPFDHGIVFVAEFGFEEHGHAPTAVADARELVQAGVDELPMFVRPQRGLVLFGDSVGRLFDGDDGFEIARIGELPGQLPATDTVFYPELLLADRFHAERLCQ